MNPHIFNYSIFPSIVRADRESTITIHPLGENALFKPGAEYTVTIRPVDCLLIKEVRYADRVDSGPTPNVTYKCIPNENGDLVVTHLFKGEQQHAILIDRPECDSKSPYFEINNFRPRKGINVQAKLAVYSLNEDLYGMRCYKGELHCHTFDSDGTQDAVHTVANYRSAGYDFIALTDHFTSFASEKSMRVFKDAPVDMTMLLGEEVHVPHPHSSFRRQRKRE